MMEAPAADITKTLRKELNTQWGDVPWMTDLTTRWTTELSQEDTKTAIKGVGATFAHLFVEGVMSEVQRLRLVDVIITEVMRRVNARMAGK